MTLTQLTNFIRVAEMASFSKAAAIVRIAQPALSRQIRNLEQELGAELLVRHPWGVTPTEAGEVLLSHARRIMQDLERARDAVDALSAEPTGRIAVGVPATLATSVLPPLALSLRTKFPRLKPRFVEDFSTGLHSRMHAGELDLALLYEEKALGPLATTPLLTEDLMLITAGDVTLDATGALAALQIVASTRPSRLREIIDAALAREGLAPTTILEVDSLPAMIRMVARGVGCTLLPYSTVADEVDRGELQALRMPGSPPRRTLLLARPLDRPASVGTRAIEAELRDIFRELSPRMGWDAALSS